jgi:rhodanese-related sulfurtransferase
VIKENILIKKIIFPFCAAAPLLLGACAADSGGGQQTVSAARAYQIMQETSAYILLDVRSQEEFAAGHIGGAILLPHDEIGQRAASALPDKNAVILVYCRSGRRSALAAQELAALGYRKVYDFGGINRWPYATVKE